MAARESSHERLRIDVSGPTALGDAVASARRYAVDQQIASRDVARLCIIVEELVANMLEHGGDEIGRQIALEFKRRDAAVALTVEDDGPAFDPRLAPDDADAQERGGGAGLRLINAWSRIEGYQTKDGRNRLELLVPLSGR